jgi:L-alanine-DL-glutamate epimerase-like enolase superfamily enzyme
MTITGLSLHPILFRLKQPYTIAYEAVEAVENVFLRLDTNSGITAFGCAAPDLAVTGETAADVLEMSDLLREHLIGEDPLRPVYLLEKLRPFLKGHPATQAMVDMALWDLIGKKAGLPVYRMLGGYRTSMMTSITIGILPLDEALKHAGEYLRQGFRSLKVKGGIDVGEDVERMIRIRELAGKEIELRFDANQGYSVADTIAFVNRTRAVGLELLEQPTSRDELEMLGEVTQLVHIPVMADESLLNLRDVFRIAKHGWADMINIKLMKVGGITEAMNINSVARAGGMEVMAGCMDEAALSIAAGLHFALARPNVHYADLDGHLDIVDDSSGHAIRLENGILFPSENPGLGGDPDF